MLPAKKLAFPAEREEIAPSTINVLLIDDNEADAFLIQELLEKTSPAGFAISHAPTIEMAEPEYRRTAFNVLLLDLNLPGLSGMEAVEKVRADLPSTPIIVMTGLDDEERALGIMQRGAQDYLVKGRYGNNILPRVIRYAIERKQFENRVIELIQFDQITGLINRDMFVDRLEGAIAIAAQSQVPLAVAALSLRRFKDVTATLGHEMGNRLLKAVALRLKENLMRQDAIARLEGDEFIVLVTGRMATPEELPGFCQGIVDAVERRFDIDGQEVSIGCSVGVATYPSCGQNAAELTKHADIALHRAKQRSKSEFQFYTSKLNDELNDRIHLEKELRAALTRQELVPYYQPIIDLRGERVCGVETLVRWIHPEKGFIPPDRFIPIAEKSELILEISDYMLRCACTDFSAWAGWRGAPFSIAVNLSTRDLQRADFIVRLKRILADTGMDPAHLALEVTESTLMEDPQQSIVTLQQCRQAGLSIYIDDFGTGYSSLSYLSRLPLDILKIDRSFVSDIMTNGHNLLIATATINLAHGLNLKVVAEGIELKEQKVMLTILGCDRAQGYNFAKPMPMADFKEWFAGQQK